MYPLDGIKILDLSRVLAGPWCTQTLADLGAAVWKIEAPGSGDDTRSWTPPDIDGESTYFMCCNRSKKSVAIDLKSAKGKVAILKMAREADVLVENFRLGALDRLGFGYEELSKLNPGLVYCSISGYGRTGPRAAEAGYDFAIQAESGLMAITGEPDGPPMKVGVAITDIITGMNATQAILAALIARGKTGRGQHLDIALLDSAVAVLANQASGHLGTGKDVKRFGNAHPTIVPYQIFETADGAFALAVGNDGQFRTLCEKVIGRPDLAEDARYARNRDRVLNRDILVPVLAEIFRSATTLHWIAALKDAGVPAGQVRSVAEVFAAPEMRERGMVVEVPDEKHGHLRLVASPLRFSDTPVRPPVAPPRLGEHTGEVLSALADGSGETCTD
ncbi:CaiB/BaiF CoA transferase family protein [Lutibaculum baratangense]|uniref:L-carnitine dehydratase/bile acid-inducible protein F n=1 Tax=Lutibaculum baratangense AMV1 TaxID=631454 RepID=V4RLA5_9HYPH|nr:CaiB/BaiF CoA-transferase family protein [Lutibaculum baratangense]ESR26836.1 L-carnitine dehydratase/bile acid-inducible protein F [Lutibaculum baratangense AMV1]